MYSTPSTLAYFCVRVESKPLLSRGHAVHDRSKSEWETVDCLSHFLTFRITLKIHLIVSVYSLRKTTRVMGGTNLPLQN